ncbi:hypothetical protein [Kribbella sp. NPDC006257]
MSTALLDDFDLDIRLAALEANAVPKAVTVHTSRPWTDSQCCSDACCDQ